MSAAVWVDAPPVPRFEIREMTGMFWVRDNREMQIYVRGLGSRPPLSLLYDTRADAEHVRTWMIDRACGYPKRDLPWPADDPRGLHYLCRQYG